LHDGNKEAERLAGTSFGLSNAANEGQSRGST
jgi:hypothetical protein